MHCKTNKHIIVITVIHYLLTKILLWKSARVGVYIRSTEIAKLLPKSKSITKKFVSAVKYAKDAEWVGLQLLLPCQHWSSRLQLYCTGRWSWSCSWYERRSL